MKTHLSKLLKFKFNSKYLPELTDKQIETEISNCYKVLKELKKEQNKRIRFNLKLERFKDYF